MGIPGSKTLKEINYMPNPYNLKVGQKLFIRDFDEYSHRKTDEIIEVTVTKVGIKFFEVIEEDTSLAWKWRDTKFSNETLRVIVKYGHPTQQAYKTLKEIEDMKEKKAIEDILNKLYYDHRVSNLTLDQLRRIKSIIEEVQYEHI
jgi:hypothetical protein